MVSFGFSRESTSTPKPAITPEQIGYVKPLGFNQVKEVSPRKIINLKEELDDIKHFQFEVLLENGFLVIDGKKYEDAGEFKLSDLESYSNILPPKNETERLATFRKVLAKAISDRRIGARV